MSLGWWQETRRNFTDWQRREPWRCAITCAWFVFFAVQGVLRLLTGGDDPTFWLAIAFMYGAYIGAKLEVSAAHFRGYIHGAAVGYAAAREQDGTR